MINFLALSEEFVKHFLSMFILLGAVVADVEDKLSAKLPCFFWIVVFESVEKIE